jgi:hypothetical protein
LVGSRRWPPSATVAVATSTTTGERLTDRGAARRRRCGQDRSPGCRRWCAHTQGFAQFGRARVAIGGLSGAGG